MDYTPLIAALDPNSPPIQGEQTLLERATFGKTQAEVPGVFSLSIGSSEQAGIKMRQPEGYLVPILDKMIVNDLTPEDLPPEEAEKFIRSATDLMRSFTVDLNQASDIKAEVTPPEGEYMGKKFAVSLSNTRMKGLDSNGLEEMSISGLMVQGPDNLSISLGRAAIEDLGFPAYEQLEKVIRVSMAGDDPSPSDIAKLSPSSLTFSVKDLAYKDMANHDVQAKEIRTELKSPGLAVPTYLSTKIDGLTLSKNLIKHPLGAVLMTQLGLEKLTIDEEVTLNWDKASETFNLSPLDIKLSGIARLAGSIGFGGIKEAYLDNPENASSAMATATVLPSSLTLSDDGGLNQLINLAGAMSGLGPDQLRQMAEGQVQAMLSIYTKPAFARMVAGEVKSFMTDPKSLKIALTPGAPVPVAQILGVVATTPQDLPDVLKIGVTANGK